MKNVNLEVFKNVEFTPAIASALFSPSKDDLNLLISCNMFGGDFNLYEVLNGKWPMFVSSSEDKKLCDVEDFIVAVEYHDPEDWSLTVFNGYLFNSVTCNHATVTSLTVVPLTAGHNKYVYKAERPWNRLSLEVGSAGEDFRIDFEAVEVGNNVFFVNEYPKVKRAFSGKKNITYTELETKRHSNATYADYACLTISDPTVHDIVSLQVHEERNSNSTLILVDNGRKMYRYNDMGLPLYVSEDAHYSRFCEYDEKGRIANSKSMTLSGVSETRFKYTSDDKGRTVSASTQDKAMSELKKFDLTV